MTVATKPAVPAVQPTAAPDFGAQIDSAVAANTAKQDDITQRQEAERTPLAAATNTAADELTKLADTPAKAVPLPENAANHLDPKQLNEAASIWMTLGALGGLLMRQPMTAALGNMTAAMKGVQEGDAEQYDRAMKEFNTNYDKAMKTNAAMLKEKETALKDKNLSLTARMEQLRLIDVKYGNETGRATKDFNTQMKLIDAHMKLTEKAEATRARLQQAQDMMQLRRDQMAAKSAAASGGGGGGGGKPDPRTVDFFARQSLSGDNSWQVGLARGKVGQVLISAVKDRIPSMAEEFGMTAQDVSMNKAARESISKALSQRQIALSAGQQFIRQFKTQADLVDKYLEPGVGGSVPIINKWIQAGRSATGDPDVKAFDTAIRGLSREHQRIITGVTSNAQLHVSAQQTADELLNKNMTADQIRSTLKVMREEAENAVEAGKQEVEFNRDLLKHLGPQPGKANQKPAANHPAPPAGFKVLD